jgi:hypothetical protein
MTDDALAELLAALSADLDVRLTDMRRRDALRDASCCTSEEAVASVRHRFELAQLVGDDDAPGMIEGRLQ